jgi:hypothetical protein
MLDLTITSYGSNAITDLSGLGALNAETPFINANGVGGTSATFRISNADWDRVRPNLRKLTEMRMPLVENGVLVAGTTRPVVTYTLMQAIGNHPRITRVEETSPVSPYADGALVVRGMNMLGGIQAKLDLLAQSSSVTPGPTGTQRFQSAVRALRLTAVPFGPRGRKIGIRIMEPGSASVTVALVGEEEVRVTVTPATGLNTATEIAGQITASAVASYYMTATALVGSAKIGPTANTGSPSSTPPQVRLPEYEYLRGGDGGGVAELLVPVVAGVATNGLKLVAQKSGNPGNNISLVLRMEQGADAVVVSNGRITVDRTGATETIANLVTAINGNASAAALVLASARGTGSLGAKGPLFLYGGAGEEPVASVGGAAATVTEHTNTSLKLAVGAAAYLAAGGADQMSAVIQILLGDRKMSAQVMVGANRTVSFRATVRAQSSVTIATPGATIDGVTMVAGERFWAPSQGTATQDGLYVWNGASVPATRAPEMPVGMDVAGMLVSITEGTDAGKIAQVTNATAAGVIGTHGLTDAFI